MSDSSDLAKQLQAQVVLLEKVLRSLDDAGESWPPIAAPSSGGVAVDISGELKPYFRRLFSGDQLKADTSVFGGSQVGVTVEVLGEGESVERVLLFVETGDAMESDGSSEETQSGVCGNCSKTLAPGDKAWNGAGSTYCSDCFVCKTCAKSLQDGQFVRVGPSLFCGKHAEMCATCGKPLLTGKIISALDKRFHMECFVCAECQRPFGNEESICVSDGKPYCAVHAPDDESFSSGESPSSGDSGA